MAATDALDAQPAATENAVLHDCLDHILAACRRVTARGRREGRDASLVEIDRKQKYMSKPFFHLSFDIWSLTIVIYLRLSSDLGEEFVHGAGDLLLRGHLLIHMVDGDVESPTLLLELLERLALQAIRFAHKPAQTVAVNSVLVQGFGCPNHDLRLSCHRNDMRPQRPRYVAFALRARGLYAQVATKAHGFGESETH